LDGQRAACHVCHRFLDIYIRYIGADVAEASIDPFFIAFETILSALSESERKELITRMEDIRTRTENALQLKFGYGLGGIADDPNELEHIRGLENGHVFWLNTLFRDAEKNMVAILEAVKRGNNVDLLMMSPFSEYAEVLQESQTKR